MQHLTLKIPKGQLIFGNEKLVISDNQAIRLSRISLTLLSFTMLAVLIKGWEFLNFTSWFTVASIVCMVVACWAVILAPEHI